MNEVDKMIEARGWICDWDVSTAERVEKLIIEQMNLVHELSMENEEHRKVFAEIFLALGTDETDRTKWAGMIREMKQLLKLIWESDCLPDWAFEHCDDDEPIGSMVRKIVKDSK